MPRGPRPSNRSAGCWKPESPESLKKRYTPIVTKTQRVLSVSYDPTLLATRAMVLNLSGYDVISAEGFTEAMERCRQGGYHLLIIGHSIPHKDKQAIIHEVRKAHAVPVLALLRPNEPQLAEATRSMEAADGPEALLRNVQAILAGEKE